MKYIEMTKSQRVRVRYLECPLCKSKFTKLDDVQEIKMKYGKAMLYFDFHSNCLLKTRFPSQLEEVQNGKEEIN